VSKPHIALIGFMAAGKTTIGRRLAQELELPFVDTDQLIVGRHGSISRLFARYGDEGFRKRELEAVREALDGPPAVIALGGGAVTYGPTRDLVAERALRVYLDIPLETLVKRLRRARHLRPVMGKEPTPERIAALLEARLPLYREAEIVVAGGKGSQVGLAREIADLVRAR
jgi:shikimate kinase